MSSVSTRVALVGCGEIAATHVRALMQLDGVVICAVADLDDRRRSAVARQAGGVAAYSSAEELFEAERPDTVHVLTSPTTHAALSIAAMEAGAHVLVEKPMALSTLEADQMLETAKRTERILGTCHNWVFKPAVRRAVGLVQSEAIGKVVHVVVFWGQSGGYTDIPGSHWAWRLPGGIFTNVLPHAISLQQEFLGNDLQIGDVVVVREQRGATVPTELSFAARGQEGWGTITISNSTRPVMKFVEIYGTRGVLRVDLAREICVIQKQRRVPGIAEKVIFGIEHAAQLVVGTAASAVMVGLGKWRHNPGMAPLIADFYRSVRSGEPPRIDAERGSRTVAAMQEVWEKAGSRLSPDLRTSDVGPRTEAERTVVTRFAGKRVVVTGAAGFLGSHLARALHRCGAEVAVIARDPNRLAFDIEAFTEVFKGDLSNSEMVKAALRRADVVFHCAATTTNTVEWQQHYEDTVMATTVVCEGAIAESVNRIVHVSSVAVYGMDEPHDGRVIDETTPLVQIEDPWEKYARAKVQAEEVVRRFEREKGLRASIVRPGILYGPDRPIKGGIVRLGNWLITIGSARNALPFTFVDNAVDALLLAACSDDALHEAFNVVDDPQQSVTSILSSESTGTPVRIIPFPTGLARFLARLIERRAAKSKTPSAPRLTVGAVRGATRDIRYDTRKARKILGWHSEVRPSEAMRREDSSIRSTGGR